MALRIREIATLFRHIQADVVPAELVVAVPAPSCCRRTCPSAKRRRDRSSWSTRPSALPMSPNARPSVNVWMLFAVMVCCTEAGMNGFPERIGPKLCAFARLPALSRY